MKGYRLTTEQFIVKAKAIHGNKYDYSKVVYIDNETKVLLICIKHGIFEQKPRHHIRKKRPTGCPKCSIFRKKDQDHFITVSQKVHNNKYDYSQVIYNGWNNKVKIICPIHGPFTQRASNHKVGNGCHVCGIEKTASQNELLLRDLIKKQYPSLKMEFNYREHPALNGLELDIWLPDIGLGIEWNGAYWHDMASKKHLDNIKKKRMGENIIQILDEGSHDPLFVHSRFLLEVYPVIKSRLTTTSAPIK